MSHTKPYLAGAIVGLLAVAVPTLLVTALRGERAAVVPVLVAFGAAFGVSVFVVAFAAVLGLLGLPTAFAALVVAIAAIGTVLYYLETGILMTSVAFYRSDRPQSGGRYGNCLH